MDTVNEYAKQNPCANTYAVQRNLNNSVKLKQPC